jgi:hypothetical protein
VQIIVWACAFAKNVAQLQIMLWACALPSIFVNNGGSLCWIGQFTTVKQPSKFASAIPEANAETIPPVKYKNNAEAIPPVIPWITNYSVCSCFFLHKFTNYSVRFLYHFFVRIVVIDVRWTTEDFIHSYFTKYLNLSFSASASVEIKNNLDGLKTARRETLFYLLDCRMITVKFILSYNLFLITTI